MLCPFINFFWQYITVLFRPNGAKACYYRGNAKAQNGQFEGAIVDFDEALHLKPDWADAYFCRGLAKVDLGHYLSAITDFDETLRLEPSHAEAYAVRGSAKVYLGEFNEAVQDLDTALDLVVKTKDTENIVHIQSMLASSKSLQNASESELHNALQKRINKQKANEYLTYFKRGDTKIKLGNYTGAVADYTQAILLRPDIAETYNNRALIKGILKEYNAAIADYDEAIRLKPDYTEAYAGRGQMKLHISHIRDGRVDIEKALKLAVKAGNEQLKAQIETLLSNTRHFNTLDEVYEFLQNEDTET